MQSLYAVGNGAGALLLCCFTDAQRNRGLPRAIKSWSRPGGSQGDVGSHSARSHPPIPP